MTTDNDRGYEDDDAERRRERPGHRDKKPLANAVSSAENTSSSIESGLPNGQGNTSSEDVSTSRHLREGPDSNGQTLSHIQQNRSDDDDDDYERNNQDNAHSSPRKWPVWVPFPIERTCMAVVRWTAGPPNAQPHRIKPLCPATQQLPLRVIARLVPGRRRRRWLLLTYLAIWIVAFVLIKRRELVANDVGGWGAPRPLSCGAAYFARGNLCGVDGGDCRPFNGSTLPFRCPANCARYRVLNPRAVGDQEVAYRPLVIGGGHATADAADVDTIFYRGDSYICGAAVHAGVVSNFNGGCGIVQLIGRRQSYSSSDRNGIVSVSFDSYFPLSIRFVRADCGRGGDDARWPLLALSVVFTAVLGLCTASPAAFYFPVFVGTFFTVGMATDPPAAPNVAELVSRVVGRFLPAAFVGWVIYDRMGARRVLAGLAAPVEKIVLWLGACWVGALSNITLDFIPIQRLSAHEIAQEPGARAALAAIIALLAIAFGFQAWGFRREGRLRRVLALYTLFLAGIIIALVLPNLNLRIHHYIMGLLLLPGTAMQTRPSLLYQGLLLGLFINGVARWGFASLLETSVALQGDAQLGSLLPKIADPVIKWSNSSSSATDSSSNITFTWSLPTKDDDDYNGISILVNDVERYRAFFDDTSTPPTEFTWSRPMDLDLPEYFRFAYMMGSDAGDYTKAGVWTKDGEWRKMALGPSK